MKPTREPATNTGQTYMVTSATWERRMLFKNDRWAQLFVDTLLHYRGKAYLLHEFVVMPDHFHAILTPSVSLEKTLQFIKGGFSHRAKVELGSNMEVWQRGFSDHRIRDSADFEEHVRYVHQNPIRERLVEKAEDHPYTSAQLREALDPVPQGLKPIDLARGVGTAEAVPFQSSSSQNSSSRVSPSQVSPSQDRSSQDPPSKGSLLRRTG